MIRALLICFLLSCFLSIQAQEFKGVNLVSSQSEPTSSCIQPIADLGANWVALCPFAFMTPGEVDVRYNIEDNYWGDRPQNLRKQIQEAHQLQLKVLIKPHIWVEGQGWPGDFSPGVGRWKIWEENYTNFILQLARLCEEEKVEMLCIGTEFKNAINSKPNYWKLLINDVREAYQGKLIYAANWDNYFYIPFWDKLDYIGIDGYFPLVDSKTPEVMEMNKKWDPVKRDLEKFSNKKKRKIVFTECGYRSIDGTAFKQWLVESKPSDENVNLQAQTNAYQAFFESLWKEEWFEGGFIWKWYCDDQAGGELDSDYTPQNKPAERLIKQWYTEGH